MEKELPKRKKIRIQGYDYSRAGVYFITICVKDMHELLGNMKVGAATCRPCVELSLEGQITDNAIRNIHDIYPHVVVDKYVIMPNHVHLILSVSDLKSGRQIAAPTTVQTVIGNMKRYVSMQTGYSLWQKSFYDHIIRDEEDYQRIWQYIDQNPARWQEDCYYKNKHLG